MNISIQNDVSEVGGMIDYLSLQSQVTIKEKGYRSMMEKNNLTGGGVQIETYQELLCHFLGLNK